MPAVRVMAKARSLPSRPARVPLADRISVPPAISRLPATSRRFVPPARVCPATAGTVARHTRHALHSAPPMMTSAATPLPSAARTRGATPNTSLPVGISFPFTGVRVGAVRTTPAASPLRPTSHPRTARPRRSPASRYTVPRASQGTLSTAPAR